MRILRFLTSEPFVYAFDVLAVDEEDLTGQPLLRLVSKQNADRSAESAQRKDGCLSAREPLRLSLTATSSVALKRETGEARAEQHHERRST
jgi:hypothetical protein